MEGLKLKATAKVKLQKFDESGALISEDEHEVELTEEEAEALWHLQHQA